MGIESLLQKKNICKKRRIGRGTGSGKGKTSGRGQKGDLSRSNPGKRELFEGGQTPYIRRIPKFGFHNRNKVHYKIVNIKDLSNWQDVKEEDWRNIGFNMKILGDGEIDFPIMPNVYAMKFSLSAIKKIREAGGEPNILKLITRKTKRIYE